MIVDMSTPITCFAPALAANLRNEVSLGSQAAQEMSLHAKDTGSTANIKDDLVLEEMLVLNDSVHV
jgi:hypothetical protein